MCFISMFQIPVFIGASEPILPPSKLRSYPTDPEFYGKDGLGDNPTIFPAANLSDIERVSKEKFAAQFIVDTIEKYPGSY